MNLADMLSYVDIHELSRIAKTYDCACNSHSKNDLIQSILTTISRKDVFEKHVLNLSLEDIRFLNSLMFDGKTSFSLEELIARAQSTRFQKQEPETWNPRETISRFKGLGWLFHGFSQQNKYLYQVPQDLKRRFTDVLARKYREHLQYTGEPAVYRDEHTLILSDIETFLRFVDRHDVPMTAEHFMYRKVLHQVLGEMAVREEPVARGGWRFGYGSRFKEYPNRFSLIYDYCYFSKWISEENGYIILTPEGKARINKGMKDNLPDVYHYWLRLYKIPIPNLPSLVHWVEQLASNWVQVNSLREVMCPLIRPYYYDTPESILDQRILQMMMHLGLLAIGEVEAPIGQVVRVTPLGAEVLKKKRTHRPDGGSAS